MVVYFREYIHDMCSRTKHLHALLHKGTPFKWASAHDAEFTDLKEALLSKICDQLAEMHQSGLDSSILPQFLP